MNLVQQVVDRLGTTEQKARDGVGLLLFAVRFATDQKTFDAIKQAVPDAQTLFTQALAAGGRTGEMLAVANPDVVRKKLESAGYGAAEFAPLGTVVADALAPVLGKEADRVRGAIEAVTAA